MSEVTMSNRLWIFLLIGSVLINGVLLGVTLHRSFDPKPNTRMEVQAPASIGRFNPRAFMEALSEEDREIARDRLREGQSEMRALMRNTIEARRRVWNLMNEEQLDLEAVQIAMTEARQARSALETHGESIVLEIISELDQEERQNAFRSAYPIMNPMDRRGHRREQRRQPPPEY